MTTPHDAAQALLFQQVADALAATAAPAEASFDRTVPDLMQAVVDAAGHEVRLWLNWRPTESQVIQRQIGDGRGLSTVQAAGDVELIAAGPDGDGGPGPRDTILGSLIGSLAAQLALPRVITLPPGHACGGTAFMEWGDAAMALADDRSAFAALPQVAARGLRLTLTFIARSPLEAA